MGFASLANACNHATTSSGERLVQDAHHFNAVIAPRTVTLDCLAGHTRAVREFAEMRDDYYKHHDFALATAMLQARLLVDNKQSVLR